jgi:D-amino peptidase
MMTEDVNAAVRGALAGGATQVTVNDAHGPMRNPLPDLLHPAAELIRGRPKPMGMLEGLGGDFDATVCVGYHARAGALGVLSHSFMGREIEDIWLDDRPAGEIGLVHATAVTLRDSRTAQVSGRIPDLFRLLSVFISVAAALTGQSPYC